MAKNKIDLLKGAERDIAIVYAVASSIDDKIYNRRSPDSLDFYFDYIDKAETINVLTVCSDNVEKIFTEIATLIDFISETQKRIEKNCVNLEYYNREIDRIGELFDSTLDKKKKEIIGEASETKAD